MKTLMPKVFLFYTKADNLFIIEGIGLKALTWEYIVKSKRHKNPTKSDFAKILYSLGESRDYIRETYG
jgi:hypothetical protein